MQWKRFMNVAQNIVNKMVTREELDEIKSDHEMAFLRRGRTLEESLAFLDMKARSDGFQKSFLETEAIVLISSSVYINSFPSIILRETETGVKMANKEEISSATAKRVFDQIIARTEEGKPIVSIQTYDTKRVTRLRLFEIVSNKADPYARKLDIAPYFWEEQRNFYELADFHRKGIDKNAVHTFKNGKAKRTYKKLLRKVERIHTEELMDVCCWKWFNWQDSYSPVYEDMWNHFRRHLSFLKPTIEETLSAGGFRNSYELKNYLLRADPRDVSTNILGVATNVLDDDRFLIDMVRLNFYHNANLIKKMSREAGRSSSLLIDNLFSDIKTIYSLPYLTKEKNLLITNLHNIYKNQIHDYGRYRNDFKTSLILSMMSGDEKAINDCMMAKGMENYIMYLDFEVNEDGSFGASSSILSFSGTKFIILAYGIDIQKIVPFMQGKRILQPQWKTLMRMLERSNLRTFKGHLLIRSSFPYKMFQDDPNMVRKVMNDVKWTQIYLHYESWGMSLYKGDLKLMSLKYPRVRMEPSQNLIDLLKKGNYFIGVGEVERFYKEEGETTMLERDNWHETPIRQYLGTYDKVVIEEFVTDVVKLKSLRDMLKMVYNRDDTEKLLTKREFTSVEANILRWVTRNLSFFDELIGDAEFGKSGKHYLLRNRTFSRRSERDNYLRGSNFLGLRLLASADEVEEEFERYEMEEDRGRDIEYTQIEDRDMIEDEEAEGDAGGWDMEMLDKMMEMDFDVSVLNDVAEMGGIEGDEMDAIGSNFNYGEFLKLMTMESKSIPVDIDLEILKGRIPEKFYSCYYDLISELRNLIRNYPNLSNTNLSRFKAILLIYNVDFREILITETEDETDVKNREQFKNIKDWE
jgi:hypothetical protein